MRLEHLTYLIGSLSILVDAGERTDVGETVDHIHNANLFAWLAEKYTPRDPNFLFGFRAGAVWESAAPEILAAFADLEPELHRIRKKLGIEHNGLCLLISWTAELIYRRVWNDDPPAEGHRIRLGDPPQC